MMKAECKCSYNGKVLWVHYHHVHCETLVYSEMMSVFKQEVALHACVCVCAYTCRLTDEWTKQCLWSQFTDLL